MRFKVDDGRRTRTGTVTVYDNETGKPLVVTSILLDLETATAIADSAVQLLNSQNRLAGWEPIEGHEYPDIWERQQHEVEDKNIDRYVVRRAMPTLSDRHPSQIFIWDTHEDRAAIIYDEQVLAHAWDKATYEAEMMNDRWSAGSAV